MYSLTIHFGPNAMVWALLYKEEEKASVAYNAYVDHKVQRAEGGLLIGSDDYGQIFAIPMDDINGMLLEDLEAGEEARILRGLAQMRAQVKADARAKTDPMIVAALRNRGPAVMTPFSNGQFQ